MVVATYNVAPYLNAFCESIVGQSDGLDALEVILVNDGSTDNSGEIVRSWSARYPQIFRYKEQKNQGVCAARNAGLVEAKGVWICFPDPDDFLSPNYLACVHAEINRSHRRPLLAVTVPLVHYYEDTGEYANDHPLRGRFGRRTRRLRSNDMRHVLLPHTSSTFMRRADITRLGLTFDTLVRPSFEDAHFIIRLIAHNPNRLISFLVGPKYFYRKRAAGGSLVDGVTKDPDWYGPHLQAAYESLLTETKTVRGDIPIFVQACVLHSLLAKLRHVTGPDYDHSILDAEEERQFMCGLSRIMNQIDTATLRSRRIPGLHAWQRQALQFHFKGVPPRYTWVVLSDRGSDPQSGVAEITVRWTSVDADGKDVLVQINGKPAQGSKRCQTRKLFDLDYSFVFEHDVTLSGRDVLQVTQKDRKMHLFADKPGFLFAKRRWLGTRLTTRRWLSVTKRSRRTSRANDL